MSGKQFQEHTKSWMLYTNTLNIVNAVYLYQKSILYLKLQLIYLSMYILSWGAYI
jgi:hypothetical protein